MKEKEISQLNLKLVEASGKEKEQNNEVQKNNYKEIRHQINAINDSKIVSKIKGGNYQIDRNIFDSSYDTIINLTR